MTLKEAKKILKNEGFHMALSNKVIYQNGAIREFEKPEVCEAINVANANRWTVYLTPIEWDDREARLKKEHEMHANASDKMGMTLKEAKDLLKKEFAVIGIHKSTEPFEFDESRWIEHEKPSVLEAFRVLSKEGYYVTISDHDYQNRKKRLQNEYEENTKAPGTSEEKPKEGNPALKEAASQFNDALLDEQAKKIKRLGKEITRLKKAIHKKNLKIEEFRKESSRHLRGKIKMFGENLDLEHELKDKNEELRLTKIREKNLAELGLKYVGENEKLKKELADKVVDKIDARALKSAESALAYKEKVIAEKDDVIADLGKELAATKKELEEKTNLVEMVRKGSKEYREYGIAALSMIRKMAKVIVNGGQVSSEDYKEYRRLANGYSFNPQLPDFSEEEEKKLDAAKLSNITAKCMRAARESINDVFESYAAKYAKSTLDELKDKAYESFNAKAHKLGLVGSDDGKGIPDQMVRVDIDEELSKVLDDVIDQFLLFGEIIIKEEK